VLPGDPGAFAPFRQRGWGLILPETKGTAGRGCDGEEIDRGPVAGDSAGMGEERPPRGGGRVATAGSGTATTTPVPPARGTGMTQCGKGITHRGERGLDGELVEKASQHEATPNPGTSGRQRSPPVRFRGGENCLGERSLSPTAAGARAASPEHSEGRGHSGDVGSRWSARIRSYTSRPLATRAPALRGTRAPAL